MRFFNFVQAITSGGPGAEGDECARLAAVIPSTLRHQPTETSLYVEKKTELILRRMSTH